MQPKTVGIVITLSILICFSSNILVETTRLRGKFEKQSFLSDVPESTKVEGCKKTSPFIYSVCTGDGPWELNIAGMKELGLEYVNVRGRFSWPEMEPQDDKWDWSDADKAMDTVEKYGMKMVPIFVGPPEHWISQDSPDLPSEFAEYCTEVVKRYKDRPGWSGIVTIWNEPLVFFHDMTPEQYVKVLNAGYDAIKAMDPDTIVVGFNTCPAVFELPFPGESMPWLESAFQHNPKFDWFGHHTYGSASPTVSGPFKSYGGEKGLIKIRAWLDERGYSDKPIFISEKGFGIMVGEDKVAQFAPECYAISQSLGANVVGLAWWNYHYATFGDGDFGMTDRDDQPEPWRKRKVWYTYQTMIKEAELPEYIFEAKESGEFDSLEPAWVLRFHGRENRDYKLWFMFTPWIGDQNKEPQTVTINISPATSATLIDWMGGKTTVFPDATGNVIVNVTSNPCYLKALCAKPLSIEIVRPKEGYVYFFDRRMMRVIGNTIIIGKITVEADVVPEDTIRRVEFYIDEVLKNVDERPPYNWLWDETLFGWHELKVVAFDESGKTVSDEMNVIIFNI